MPICRNLKSLWVCALLVTVVSNGTAFSDAKTQSSRPASLADATLKRDVMLPVLSAAATANPGCRLPNIINTKVLTFPDRSSKVVAGRVSAPWEELWNVDACGRVVPVHITFIPDPDPRKGTTYQVTLAKLKP